MRYHHVRDILLNGRDRLPHPGANTDWVSPEHDNVRGAANYH